jgi:hypothetical protein
MQRWTADSADGLWQGEILVLHAALESETSVSRVDFFHEFSKINVGKINFQIYTPAALSNGSRWQPSLSAAVGQMNRH